MPLALRSRAGPGRRAAPRAAAGVLLALLAGPARGVVTISEIGYRPPPGDEALEFVELSNDSATPEDISGYAFVEGIRFEMPAGTVLSRPPRARGSRRPSTTRRGPRAPRASASATATTRPSSTTCRALTGPRGPARAGSSCTTPPTSPRTSRGTRS
ncbi:MAG: lamin tail domain-containing protein [Planctomycetes bacterium]|nr:lamin tail domain-containing protein [Planctomycetota bacterium]